MKITKLAILGKLATKFKAPFDDPNYDIWVFNYHKIMPPRYNLWFDLHSINPNPIADITRNNFPFSEITNLMGGNYINNSASYLIAYAILKGYKEIELYGMRFESPDEIRRQEYHNVRELIFFAKGKGIKISAPFDPPLFNEYPLYGI